MSVNKGVATVETWKFTMPVLGLMVGTSLHVLEVVVVTLGSEDDCNIHFFYVMSTVRVLDCCLMKGSDYFCSYPCLMFIPIYHLTYVLYAV